MTELIERDKNHPSVVMWSVGSHRSDSGSENFSRHLKRMMEFTRKMDMQKRPVTYLISSDYRFGVMEDPAVCSVKRVWLIMKVIWISSGNVDDMRNRMSFDCGCRCTCTYKWTWRSIDQNECKCVLVNVDAIYVELDECDVDEDDVIQMWIWIWYRC